MTALSIFQSRKSFPQPGRLSLRQTYVSNLRSSAPLLSVFNVFEEVRVQTSHWDPLITGEVVWPRQTGGEVGLGGRVAELVLKWSPPGMPPAQSEWPTGERTWYKKEWRDQAAFIHSDLIKTWDFIRKTTRITEFWEVTMAQLTNYWMCGCFLVLSLTATSSHALRR